MTSRAAGSLATRANVIYLSRRAGLQASQIVRGFVTPEDLGIINVAEYVATVPDIVPWAGEPFTYYGGVSMLAGIWKGGKSTLMAQLMRCRETGGTFLGNPVDIGPTLLLTEESGYPVKRKVGGLTRLDILDRHTAVKTEGLDLDSIIEAITFWAVSDHKGERCMVIIDTWAVWGGIEDENDAVQATKAIEKLMRLARETGAAVVLVHHSSKQGGTHGRGIRGSGAIPAMVDIYGTLDYKGSGGTSRSLAIEGRVGDPLDLTLLYDPETGYTLDEPDLVAEYEAWLQKVPTDGEGYTEGELINLWGESRSSTKRRITKLLDIGRMREVYGKHPGSSRRAKRYWSIPPQARLLNLRRAEEDGNQ